MYIAQFSTCVSVMFWTIWAYSCTREYTAHTVDLGAICFGIGDCESTIGKLTANTSKTEIGYRFAMFAIKLAWMQVLKMTSV